MTTPQNSDSRVIFWDHIEEFRITFIRILFVIFAGIIVSLFFYQQIFAFLTYPLKNGAIPAGYINDQLVILSPSDGICATIKVCFWAALVGTSPVWLYFLLLFITPALRLKEKKIIFPFLFFSLLFLALGFFFAFYITIPAANKYLIAFNQGIGVNLWTLNNYFDYTVLLLLANSLAFEISVILLFLVYFGVVTAKNLKDKRRHAIVFIFILSAIITPPDIVSQILLSAPLVLLYECAVIYARLCHHRLDINPEIL